MLLRGSCHCGAVAFTLKSTTPYPYMRCYCSICRKTDGGGGYAINIMGEAATLKVKGKAAISIYRARLGSGKSKKPAPAADTFAVTAAARFGSPTRAGPNGSIPSLQP